MYLTRILYEMCPHLRYATACWRYRMQVRMMEETAEITAKLDFFSYCFTDVTMMLKVCAIMKS